MEIYNGTYCVYIHTNKINNKKYIGQTQYGDDPNKRWRNGFGYKDCTYFYKAIQKYGWNNFEHEIIASNLTQEEANHFEELLIEKFETMSSDKGYNIKSGGENHIRSEASIVKQVSAMKNTIRERHKIESFKKYQERFDNCDPAIKKCSTCGALFEVKLKWNKSHTKLIPKKPNIKRCKDCREYQPEEVRVITCVDCGIDVLIYNKMDHATCRCSFCQSKKRLEDKRNSTIRYRQKNSVNLSI